MTSNAIMLITVTFLHVTHAFTSHCCFRENLALERMKPIPSSGSSSCAPFLRLRSYSSLSIWKWIKGISCVSTLHSHCSALKAKTFESNSFENISNYDDTPKMLTKCQFEQVLNTADSFEVGVRLREIFETFHKFVSRNSAAQKQCL